MAQVVTDKARSLMFANIIIMSIAGAFLSTALTTALAPIMTEFGISVTTGQWMTTGFSLALAIITPATAFLIHRFQTKNLYCFALGLFTLGMLISATSVNFTMMMVGRIIQAIGNGLLIAMTQVLILTMYPPEKRGSAMGMYGLSLGIAPIFAPTLAGILVDSFGWRMIFIIPLIITVITFIMALIVFKNVIETGNKKFDTFSFLLSALAFGGLTLGIGNLGTNSFFTFNVLGLTAIGLVTGALFVFRQLKSENPFLNIQIFSNKNFTMSVLGSMVLFAVMMGSTVIFPLYVQQTLGLSATVAGLATIPGSVAVTFFNPIAGKIYDKYGMRTLFIIGAIGMILGNIGMCFITLSTSVWIAAILNAVRSIAIGCLMMPLMTWGTSSIEPQYTADGSALITALRTIAGAMGTAIFVGILSSVTLSASSLNGVRAAFFAMTLVSAILLVIAIFGCKNKKQA